MAALAWARIADSEDVWGKHRVTFWTLTLSSTLYVAGGMAVSGATFGIKAILGMFEVACTPLTTTSDYVAKYNSATGKVQLFGTGASDTAALDEAAGTFTLVKTFAIISTSD